MTMNNQERALSTLTGMTHALFMTVQAILRHYPNPKAALHEIALAQQTGLAQLENAPLSDAVIDGYQHVFVAFRALLEAKAVIQDNNPA